MFRTVRGCGQAPGFSRDSLELDYDTCMELNISSAAPLQGGLVGQPPFYPCQLEVCWASRLEIIKAHWYHPNPSYRVPLQISLTLGLLSVALGVLGVVLGLLSLR